MAKKKKKAQKKRAKKIYSFRKGAPWSGKALAKQAAQVITDLELRNGVCLPTDLIEEASEESHPLHACFDWDDEKAANEYRLDQARRMIRCVHIEYENVEGERSKPERVVISMPAKPYQGEGGYMRPERALSDKGIRDALILEALRKLQRFQEEYKHLRELSSIFTETKKVAERIEKRIAAANPKKKRRKKRSG